MAEVSTNFLGAGAGGGGGGGCGHFPQKSQCTDLDDLSDIFTYVL